MGTFSTIDPSMDIVPRGFEVMGKYAGANDPIGNHTSTYLVTIAVPLRVVMQLIERQVVPKETLTGSFHFDVSYPQGMPDWVTARLCPRSGDNMPCTASYVTLLRHAYQSINWSTIPRDYNQFSFPVFVPYELGNIRFDTSRIESAEKLLALKESECNTLVITLSLALAVCVVYIIKTKASRG